MESLRKPFFFLAIALLMIVVLMELISALLLTQYSPTTMAELAAPVSGYGISSLALMDSLVLFTGLLMGLPFLISHRFQGRIQGLLTFIAALVIGIVGIRTILVTLGLLVLMVTLLISPIFGTLAYFAIYGSFDTVGAKVILSLIMMLKLGAAACLLGAQQRFIQNNGLVLILLTSLIGTLVVSILHGFVPEFLVSITDAIAGIVVAIFAVIWSLFLLIGSLISMVRAVA